MLGEAQGYARIYPVEMSRSIFAVSSMRGRQEGAVRPDRQPGPSKYRPSKGYAEHIFRVPSWVQYLVWAQQTSHREDTASISVSVWFRKVSS